MLLNAAFCQQNTPYGFNDQALYMCYCVWNSGGTSWHLSCCAPHPQEQSLQINTYLYSQAQVQKSKHSIQEVKSDYKHTHLKKVIANGIHYHPGSRRLFFFPTI